MKGLLGPTLSVENGQYYHLENKYLNHKWLGLISIFDGLYCLLEKEGGNPYSVVDISKYPREIGDNSSGDIYTIKSNLVDYCYQNGIIYLDRFDIVEKEQLLSHVLKLKGIDVCNHLKRSMLIMDIIENISENYFPSQNIEFTKELEEQLIDFKNKPFVVSYVEGVNEIVDSYSGCYYLSDEILTDIHNSLSSKFKMFLSELNFAEIGNYDFNVLVEDVAGTVGGLIMGVLPIGTIKETYNYFRNKKNLKENSDILVVLSINLLSKIFLDQIGQNGGQEFEICKYCAKSMAEGFSLDVKELDDFILKDKSHVCHEHLKRYLEGRKFHRLTGYSLFEYIKQI